MALTCGMLGCLCYGGGDWLMPASAFRLGFTNGLISESMIVWFGIMLAWRRKNRTGRNVK